MLCKAHHHHWQRSGPSSGQGEWGGGRKGDRRWREKECRGGGSEKGRKRLERGERERREREEGERVGRTRKLRTRGYARRNGERVQWIGVEGG